MTVGIVALIHAATEQTGAHDIFTEWGHGYICGYEAWTNMAVHGRQHFDGLVWERCNSSALAMELHLSCTNPSIYGHEAWTIMAAHGRWHLWSWSLNQHGRPWQTTFVVMRPEPTWPPMADDICSHETWTNMVACGRCYFPIHFIERNFLYFD